MTDRTPTSPERPEVECAICRDSNAGSIGKDENGLVYPAATRSTIAHELPGSYFECRELPACADCRVAVGAVIGLERESDECDCGGDLPIEVWYRGMNWIVRCVDGEIFEAGPSHPERDAEDVLKYARSHGVAEATATAVRALLDQERPPK